MVAGITFRVKDMAEITTDDVVAEREPDNQFDKYAVRISLLTAEGKLHHIGYVPKDIACRIYDKELPVKGKIVWRCVEPGQVGLRIQI
jgi:hypothetical protein